MVSGCRESFGVAHRPAVVAAETVAERCGVAAQPEPGSGGPLVVSTGVWGWSRRQRRIWWQEGRRWRRGEWPWVSGRREGGRREGGGAVEAMRAVLAGSQDDAGEGEGEGQ